jgi:tetratricopeptide (TPR) repeat protein
MPARTGRFVQKASVRIASAVVAGGLLVVAAGAVLAPSGDGRSARAADSRPTAVGSGSASANDLAVAVRRAQTRLQKTPNDAPTWAELGQAYVQQARVTADPSFYPKAEGALKRSLSLRQKDNAPALIGMGALAAAKHDFVAALGHAKAAVKAAPFSGPAYGVLADACIELGRYDEAYNAVQKMIDLRPGTSSYARASYTFELRGELDNARDALEQALELAPSASDAGFALYHLGELAFNAGDLSTAGRRYDEGIQRAPDYLPLVAGRAKVRAARGEVEAALADYRSVVARVPLAGYLAEFGDLLAATGDKVGAAQQFELVRASQRLLAGSGVETDLDLALFDADHGKAAAALAAARTSYAKRKSIFAADALAWALHMSGRDAEALKYAKEAVRLGTLSAMFRFHLGAIEAKLGQRAAARSNLELALKINPHFSVQHVPTARALLASLRSAK